MIDITNIPDINSDPLRYCLKNNLLDQDGLWLEFGVWKGQTIDLISQYTDNPVYGFDTFSGLDYEWSIAKEENMQSFDLGGMPLKSVIPIDPDVRFGPSGTERPFKDNVEFVVGLFENTLSDFLRIKNRKISFIHVDCDIYESAKTVLESCLGYIKDGCIVVFDQLVNYEGYKDHELKALSEFISESNLFNIEWIGMNGKICERYNYEFPIGKSSPVACKLWIREVSDENRTD